MKDIIWLTCAAINIGIALLHIYVIFKGASAYRYFGAGEWMASKSEAGSFIPALVTWVITFTFFGFATYNLAGAQIIVLPFLVYVLSGITFIYLFRGAAVIAIPFMSTEVSSFDKISSFIALGIGLLHSMGTYIIYMEQVKS